MQPWTRLDDGQQVTKAGFRNIVHKKFRINNGHVMQADISDPDGRECAGVIALTADHTVVVAREFRCGPELVLDEMPGGFVDPGETPEVAARRELLEETGYEAETLEYLGYAYENAWSNAKHHYFLGLNCRKVADKSLEDSEEIEVRTISIPELIDNARSAKMSDIQAVFFAYDKLKTLEQNT